LNYAITPKRIPVPKIIASIESGIYHLCEESKATIRASVVNTLKNTKTLSTTNISKQQSHALRNLKKDKDITIVPADKGRAIVVMNTNDYDRKISDLLLDKKTCLRITDRRRNPTSKVEQDLNKLLRDIKSERSDNDNNLPQINEKLYDHLHSSSASPATFYGLPKIHKPDIPLRPITSSISFPTYNLSKHLVIVLSPLIKGRYTVRNSTDFSKRIKDMSISTDEVMVSFDVVSLFTSIPVNLALKITRDKLESDRELSTRTEMSVSNILKLLEFVLTNSYFTYKNEYYQQTSGCAMGSPISATIANLVMEYIEEIALTTALNPPRWWFRFVDDSHACLKRKYVEEFHQHLNSIDKQIQFTIEAEENNRLPFLDTVTIRQNGQNS
jgi:hypothetical protein